MAENLPTAEEVLATINGLVEQNQVLAQALQDTRRYIGQDQSRQAPAAPPPAQGSDFDRQAAAERLKQQMLGDPVAFVTDLGGAIQRSIEEKNAARAKEEADKAAAARELAVWQQDWLAQNKDIADPHILPTFERYLQQQNPSLEYGKAVELAAQQTRQWLVSLENRTAAKLRGGRAGSVPAPGGFNSAPSGGGGESFMDERSRQEEMIRKTKLAMAKKRGLIRVAS